LEHPHVKAVFGRIKTVQSKSVPEMAGFRKFKGPNIKYSYRDPQKALPYPERRHLTYFACMPGAVQNVITPANFCEDRLRGFGVTRGRISAFSIDLLRRL